MSAQPAEGWRIMEKANELAGEGVEFALATVVWRQAPSSAHQGARAIITADGEMHGWIGGACAEPVVVREAQRVIRDRHPSLILLGTPEQFGEIPAGMMFVPMSCQSEGALQLYLEPVLSSPRLVVVGRSPMTETLVDLATVLGWKARLIDASGFTDADVDNRSVVIIATQGHGDEEAIEQAVIGRPAFIGLVASHKRGEAVLGYLADRGVARELLDEVHVPVGLDLGRTSHPEIAVAVLAELVALRAQGELDPHHTASAAPSAQLTPQERPAAGSAIDLVCGMTVPADETSRPVEYEGETFYFCCPGCRTAFEKDPMAYMSQETTC